MVAAQPFDGSEQPFRYRLRGFGFAEFTDTRTDDPPHVAGVHVAVEVAESAAPRSLPLAGVQPVVAHDVFQRAFCHLLGLRAACEVGEGGTDDRRGPSGTA